MTTMLEKAALAICNQIRDSHDLEPIKTLDLVENPNVFRRQARAALQAMRDVDQETFNAGWDAMNGEPDAGPGEPWLAMIDAILSERSLTA